ncbi:MAG: hypothetical protein HXX80_06290 [Nitrososphaerales archaeon]|nr:hypothetical protein [Nitrososphaerales archaeon]
MKNKSMRTRRGSASIIAAVLFTAIFVTVIGGYFYTNQLLIYNYNQEVRENTIIGNQQAQEQFGVDCFLDENNFVWARVNNTGPITIKISHVFVIDAESSDVIKDLSVSVTLNSGLWEPEINTTYSYQGEPVIVKVLTERGNTGANIYPPLIIYGLGELKAGPFIFSLDPTDFTYKSRAFSIDQKQDAGTSVSSTYRIYGSYWNAQSFVAGTTGSLTKVEVYIRKTGSPADLTVQIRSNSGNNPSSVLASQTVSASTVGSSYGMWESVKFSTSIQLTSGIKYWIVLQSNSSNSSNYYNWYYSSSSSSYSNGERKVSTTGGVSWSSPGGDYDFITCMDAGERSGPGFEIPSKSYDLIFYINITNNSDKDIAFGKHSCFLAIVPELPGHIYEDEILFALLQNTSTLQNPMAYSLDYNQIAPSKGSTVLVFGSKISGGNLLDPDDVLLGPELNDGRNDYTDENLAWTFLLISWKFVDDQQVVLEMIPYAAIHILPS